MRLIALCLALGTTSLHADVILSSDEVATTLGFGPWPPAAQIDPSNRFSQKPEAIALGEKLFFDTVLSKDGNMSCATCHDPRQGFADGVARQNVRGELLDRNTLSVLNSSQHRWFGWSGDTDNLWAQNMTPIVNPIEMNHTAETLRAALLDSPYLSEVESLVGDLGDTSPEQILVDTGKLLAAYQETLVTGKTPFDDFRDALFDGDLDAAARYPVEAQRGLQLFIGKGRCHFCHSGPFFSNGEFHDAGVAYFISAVRVDEGRFGGIRAVLSSAYNLDGNWSDDATKAGGWAVRNVRPLHSDFGTFRVPSLREVAKTAPYMHDGSLADLQSVIEHYDSIDMERLHSDGEAILAPLGLTELEKADLVAFLESLSQRRE